MKNTAPTHTGRHFLQEDSGSEIAGLIAAFLDRQGGV